MPESRRPDRLGDSRNLARNVSAARQQALLWLCTNSEHGGTCVTAGARSTDQCHRFDLSPYLLARCEFEARRRVPGQACQQGRVADAQLHQRERWMVFSNMADHRR